MNTPVVLTYSQFVFITERLSQFYINNEPTNDFLACVNYKIQLQSYLCVCYGIEKSSVSKTRKIEFFRFIGTIDSQHGYWVQSFSLPSDEDLKEEEDVQLAPSYVFRIQDCNHLRQTIFQFQDKTSLFRSTLFFVPTENKLFRIHCVLQFITLPAYSKLSYTTLVVPEKFLISEPKKKQILKRLRHQMSLWEESIEAHGTLERSLLK